MKKISRILTMLLIFALLSACADNSGNTGSDAVSETSGVNGSNTSNKTTLTLPYTANDVLNPYTSKSKSNQELCGLLFDTLVSVDNSFNISYRLASEVTQNGDSCIITLESAFFTDGSPVTAADVMYSIDQIKKNTESRYYTQVQVISSYSALSDKQLKLNLTKNCEFILYCLDFPVIKSGTSGLKNSDNKAIPPVGSGRYIFGGEAGSYSLTANASWHFGTVNIKTIQLTVLPDQTAVNHAIQVGGIDTYYSDLSDNSFPSMAGGVSAYVMRNKLVYLGISKNSSLLSNKYMRYAVSYAIDRESIAKNAYFGLAVAAAGPYHAQFTPAKGLQTLATVQNKESAVANIELSGYNKKEDGYYLNGKKPLTVKIIYNSDNTARAAVANLTAASLEAVGIKTNIQGLSYDDYVAAVSAGNCDIYVAEMRIPKTFDLFELFTAGGDISYTDNELDGISSNAESSSGSSSVSSVASDASAGSSDLDSEGADTAFGSTAKVEKTALQAAYEFSKGKTSMSEMLSCFNNDLPFIPICHHSGICVYSSEITQGFTPSENDPYNGIENAVVPSSK